MASENLWEILSPSPELRDHIASFRPLAQLYAAVKNAYAGKVGFVADLAYKTRRLVEETATQQGLGRLTKSVTFDVNTLEALRGDKGSDEGKVFNLVRGLQKEIDDNNDAAPILQPLKERAERILKDLETRKTTGLAAMDLLVALAADKDTAAKAAKESGLSPKAFAAMWALRDDPTLKGAAIDPKVVFASRPGHRAGFFVRRDHGYDPLSIAGTPRHGISQRHGLPISCSAPVFSCYRPVFAPDPFLLFFSQTSIFRALLARTPRFSLLFTGAPFKAHWSAPFE